MTTFRWWGKVEKPLPPKKNGVVRTEHPPTYEFCRDSIVIGSFYNGGTVWKYIPHRDSGFLGAGFNTSDYVCYLSQDELKQIYDKLVELNEIK